MFKLKGQLISKAAIPYFIFNRIRETKQIAENSYLLLNSSEKPANSHFINNQPHRGILRNTFSIQKKFFKSK